MASQGPIPDSYWVKPGHILTGEYPASLDPQDTQHKVRSLLETGVTVFVDLIEEGELKPYLHVLREEAPRLGSAVKHQGRPIRDLSTPTVNGMTQKLDAIDEAVESRHIVYLHSWGGIGRTGTVVGCYFV